MKRLTLVILAMVMAILACGGDPERDNRIPLDSPKYDMYFECVARQKDGGYNSVEAGARCQTLRPE